MPTRPFVPCSFTCSLSSPQAGANHSVVWLGGEHDITSREALVTTLARVIALDEPSVVIDLSEVRSMSAGTIGVILRAKEFVRHRGRSFVLREASADALSAFELFGRNLPLGWDPESGTTDVVRRAQALSSWVEVPVAEWVARGEETAQPKPSVVDQMSCNSATDAFHGAR